MNLKLGTYVKCSAYLKAVKDGVFIEKVEKGQRWNGYTAKGECYIPHGTDWNTSTMPLPDGFIDPLTTSWPTEEDIPQELRSPCEGAGDVEKTYYEVVEKEFRGYVVAVKDVVIDGWLGVDCSYDPYCGDRYFIFKRPKTTIKCALVYYALGKSRLVPLENIEELETIR